MSPWEKLLERSPSGGHFVQLYANNDATFSQSVVRYLWEGLQRGDGVLVISTEEHQEMFIRQLENSGADIRDLELRKRLVLRNAGEMLAQFMVDGRPNWHRFESLVRQLMRQVRPAQGNGLRAFGEMVGVLWKNRQFAAAIRLEQFWNKLLEQSFFGLYCAYSIDVFGKEFEVANLEGVLCTHTHLLPAQPDGTLESAVKHAMDEILGPKADELRVIIKSHSRPDWAVLPHAERTILWLRKNMPEQAEQIISRARDLSISRIAGFQRAF